MTAHETKTRRRSVPARLVLLGALVSAWACLAPAAAQAAPAWSVKVAPIGGGFFSPGATGNPTEGPGFLVTVTNTGPDPTVGTYTITDTLPEGVNPPSGGGVSGADQNANPLTCGIVERTIKCEGSAVLGAGEKAELTIPVDVPAKVPPPLLSSGITNSATVSGGGVAASATGTSPTIFLSSDRAAWSTWIQFNPRHLVELSSPYANNVNRALVDIANVGGAPSSNIEPTIVTFTTSPGLTTKSVTMASGLEGGASACKNGVPTPQNVTCEIKNSVVPGGQVRFNFNLNPGTLVNGDPVFAQISVTGGGAPEALNETGASIIDSINNAPFGWLPGLNGLGVMMTGSDGLPATQAGSHPGSFVVNLGMATWKGNVPSFNIVAAEGGPKDVLNYMPPGFALNVQSLISLCPEAQAEQESCALESAVGIAETRFNLGGSVLNSNPRPMFAVEPPPGTPASFTFNVAGVGVYPHINGGVRRGGDYAVQAISNDVLSSSVGQIHGFRISFWGDPTDPIYDNRRGECLAFGGTCPVETRQKEPLFSMPTSCGGTMSTEGVMASWENPLDWETTVTQVSDALGNPTGVTGCNALDFSPSLEARPTTNVADAPSGLDFTLNIPQSTDYNTLATAHVRKVLVKLPEGLVINPAGANGLDSCASVEIGIDPGTGVADEFDPNCPDASKIGTATVETPLLDHPMPGSVYLATPHDNPFDSLLALYVVVDDARSGIMIKLAGEVTPDPETGRLTAIFNELPQQPFDELRMNLFGGAAAVLRTPPLCGTYSTSSSLSSWAGGVPATPADSYAITGSPTGGACPESEATQPHSPSLDAGAIAPIAGAYSPTVVNLRRADGTQQFSLLSVTPPPGLIGKLAGIPYCPDSALVAAEGRTGTEEAANPSCPAASDVGTVNVGVGAGPAPYYAKGDAYLIGPYKGAPLGIAFVVPATAGPYDLGNVVVRASLSVNPATAQITAVGDKLPTIVKGIPLDVRSIQIKLDRPEFTRNPTSCNAMSFAGQLVSTLGTPASLLNRFQVAECEDLGFKPGLSLRLKGATKRTKNPALIAILKPRQGDANFARAQVRLPSAAFLDNSNIGTVCTRVQFAASQCPPASVYGSAEATSPLVDYPVSGPIYLRSSDNKLPDLVADLRGPTHQPVKFELAGRTDSIKGALRSTFEATPDVPVSSLRFELFGGKGGLIELSRNLCAKKYRVAVQFDGQNGKVRDLNPVVGTDCKGKKKPKRKKRRNHRTGGRS